MAARGPHPPPGRYADRARTGLLSPAEPEWAAGIAERLDELRAAHRWALANVPELALRQAVSLAGYAVAAGPLLVLGDVALLEGRFAAAAEVYRQVVRQAGAREPGLACEAVGSWALALSQLGELGRAGELAADCQRRAARVGAPGLVAMARYLAAECRMVTDPAGALPMLAEARELAAGTGARFVVGLAILASVSIRARAGADPAAALAAYREAIEHWRQVGNRTQQWVTLRNLVPVLVAAGRDELACRLHGALAAAPVRLPDGVPEAEALAAAVDRAQARLGPAVAGAAAGWGARSSLDDLLPLVLAATGPAGPQPADQAGSSR